MTTTPATRPSDPRDVAARLIAEAPDGGRTRPIAEVGQRLDRPPDVRRIEPHHTRRLSPSDS